MINFLKQSRQLSLMSGLFLMLIWKISAMIANECSDGETLPVVYVSGEEVCFY